MTAGPVLTVSAAVLEIVTEEPGSTLADVRGDLAARGYRPHVATVSNALNRWVDSGHLTRQEQPTRAKKGTVFCYRPVPPTEPTP